MECAISADGGVAAAGRIASQRNETDRRIIASGSEIEERVLPFRRVAARIATVWSGANAEYVRNLPKREPGQRRNTQKWSMQFHINIFLY